MALTHDGPLWISVASSRKSKSWKNKEWLWSEIVDKFRDLRRTKETVKEYAAMNKDEQAIIKDVGGFVGGVITGGRRNKGTVGRRSLLTLDIDFPGNDFAADLELLTGAAFFIYSTHKYTPASPRLRLVLPLSREMQADEYEAAARKFGEMVGMDQFDPTTFQPERLMYWPSCPVDGEFYHRGQDGPFLDPDALLSQYADWRDISQWGQHPLEVKRRKDGIREQADPLGKPGLIGAFCRTYGIAAVIEKYLSEDYEPVDGSDDRYTYLHGSTAAGLIVYDDKFAYSHHGTDPVHGVLCNAFDLVRLHKFGMQDRQYVGPGHKSPSFIAMADLARADGDVIKALHQDRVQGAMNDFQNGEEEPMDDILREVQEDNVDWMKLLKVDRRGMFLQTIENVKLLLEHDISFRGKLALNLFTRTYMVLGRLPWENKFKKVRGWTDADTAFLREYLERIYGITAQGKIQDGLTVIMEQNAFHPVRDYLGGLVWDGSPRLDTLLIDFFGVEDSDYIRAVSRKTFCAAVARILQPGVKFDNLLTLVGPQGVGKSTFVARMGGKWYSDSFGSLKNNSAMEQLQGVWLMEVGELAGLKKAELEEVKHFFSKQGDSFRPAYGRFSLYFERECIFIPTTNIDDFMQDQTGGRRFWPVKVGRGHMDVFTELTPGYVGQLWAEARQRYLEGEPLHLEAGVEAEAKVIQAAHTEQHPLTPNILDFLEMDLPDGWSKMNTYERREWLDENPDMRKPAKFSRETITAVEIWCEVMKDAIKNMTAYNTKFIHYILKNHPDWSYIGLQRGIYGTQRTYKRKI